MGIVVLGAVFVDIKGYPEAAFIPTGRNVGRVEQIHGGVGRNVAEDVANCELRPTFIGLVDESGTGVDVIRKLKSHKVNTDYMRATRDGMGTWLAIFDNEGDVAASISKRPNLLPIVDILKDHGDEIFRDVLRRSAEKVDPVRSGFGEIEKEEVSLEDRISYVEETLKKEPRTSFRRLLEGPGGYQKQLGAGEDLCPFHARGGTNGPPEGLEAGGARCPGLGRRRRRVNMGRIFYIMGKSSCGKDTIYRQLLGEGEFSFRTLVP